MLQIWTIFLIDMDRVYIGSTSKHFKDRYITHLIIKTKRTAHVYVIMCGIILTGMVKIRK